VLNTAKIQTATHTIKPDLDARRKIITEKTIKSPHFKGLLIVKSLELVISRIREKLILKDRYEGCSSTEKLSETKSGLCCLRKSNTGWSAGNADRKTTMILNIKNNETSESP
jgi:hypothetical protein